MKEHLPKQQHLPSSEANDPRIDAALQEYFEQLDRGEAIEREAFLARYPEIANTLGNFIAAEEELRKLAGDKASRESAGITTQSFAAQDQETVPPESRSKISAGTAGSGLQGQFGRYQIIRALGKGAMGAVYLAQDTQLKRYVAIKTPHFEDDPTGELLKRFYREAEAAATLRHANICPVHDVGEIDGKHFISMAYIEGRPLSDLIKSGKAQSERHMVIAVHKLARALQQAHDHGIVHRDLKPANIMVDNQGEPLVMDFGLARKRRADGEASLTHSGVLLGSPAYMSPEQIERDPDSVGPASDQYSLGVVLYEMLTGQLPFRGSVVNVLAQIITKGPIPPSELRAGLDPRIEAVCLRMMAKKASNRFPSMKAVADQLAAIVKNPAAAPIAFEKSPPPSGPPAPAPSPRGADAPQIRESARQKALTESDMTSLEELVRKCLRRRDYDQAIKIVERIPEKRRNTALRTLLEKACEKVDEIAFLICEIDEADRLNDGSTALKKAEELLKIKPGQHRATKIQEKYSGYRDGAAGRVGPLQPFTKPWNEGGWIPWSVLAFGLAAFVVMFGIMVIYLGKTAIVIDIKDPGVQVAVKGTTLTVTGLDKQSVKVEPGEQELKITSAGLETITKSFSLKKGETKTVTVSVIDKTLVGRLENEVLPVRPDHAIEKRQSPPPDAGPLPPKKPAVEAASTTALPRPFRNKLGMEFVLVPKGKAWLGGGGGRPGTKEAVIAHEFYLGKYEVTQGEWAAVTGGHPSRFAREGRGRDIVATVRNAELDRFPVEGVSREDARQFLELLNRKAAEAEWVYRLPTEDEWEYACRGGPMADKSESAYDFYLDKPTTRLTAEQANFKCDNGLKRTCKVGSYKPNCLGLFDMHGNVFEICDLLKQASDGVSPEMAIRGGGWSNVATHCTASFRTVGPASRRGGSWSFGLRVARVYLRIETVEAAGMEKKEEDAIRSTTGVERNPSTAKSASTRSTESIVNTAADPDRRAAAAVLALGGSVTVRVEGRDEVIGSSGTLPREPFELVHVNLSKHHGLADADLTPLEGASHLVSVDLTWTGVTDGGFAHLRNLTRLRSIAAQGAQITSAGLDHLQGLPELEHLLVGSTPLTDADLRHLQGLTSLKHLGLAATRITNAGLGNVKPLTGLRSLWLGKTRVSDSGLVHLKDLTELTWLDLAETRITNAGLANLAGLKNLRRLDLRETKVTDAGLEKLAALTALEMLDLTATKVTAAGVAKVHESLPNCRIIATPKAR